MDLRKKETVDGDIVVIENSQISSERDSILSRAFSDDTFRRN
jgi:hypothetical protein